MDAPFSERGDVAGSLAKMASARATQVRRRAAMPRGAPGPDTLSRLIDFV